MSNFKKCRSFWTSIVDKLYMEWLENKESSYALIKKNSINNIQFSELYNRSKLNKTTDIL